MSHREPPPAGGGPRGRRPKDSRRHGSGKTRPGPGTRPGVRPKPIVGRHHEPVPTRPRWSDPRYLVAAGGLLVLLVAAYVLSGGFGSGGSATPSGAAFVPRASNPPGCPTSQPSAEPSGQTPTVTIQTAKGTIVIKADGSPIATGNFVALAQCGFYDGLVFHRLVPGFVIQGGDPNGDGSGDAGYTIADEAVTALYHRGTVAMARTQDPHTQSSQFFIVLDDAAAGTLAQANPGYAIVGEVTSGMDVVDSIAAMPNTGGQDNLAIDPVAMTSVTVSP